MIFTLILWLNVTTGNIEGATKVGPAQTVLECQTQAAKKMEENSEEMAKITADGRVAFIACVDVSAFSEQLRHAAEATKL